MYKLRTCLIIFLLIAVPYSTTVAQTPTASTTERIGGLQQQIADYEALLEALQEQDGISVSRYRNTLEDAADDLRDAEADFLRERFDDALLHTEEAEQHLQTLETTIENIDESNRSNFIRNDDEASGRVSPSEVTILPSSITFAKTDPDEEAKRALLIKLIDILTKLIELQ